MRQTSRRLDHPAGARASRRHHRALGLSGITAVVAGALVAAVLSPPFEVAAAAQAGEGPPVELTKSIPVSSVPAGPASTRPTGSVPLKAPAWPVPSVGELDLATLNAPTSPAGLTARRIG